MKRNNIFKSGIGVGYVSVMMIFVVICLTVLAVLSYTSAGSNDELNIKNRIYMTEFYNADNDAKMMLMNIDNAAYEASESGFFDMTFEELASEINGTVLSKTAYGYNTEYKISINDRLDLSVSVAVYSNPAEHSEKRYELLKWKVTGKDSADDDDNYDDGLNVWDGNF